MLKMIIAALALAAVPAGAAPPAPVEVMVLGTYHFGNPGLDLNNVKADSVLTPRRQAELDAVARSIATFKPTRVMVEMRSSAPDLAVAAYTQFKPESLQTQANEIDQIGFRIARLIGLATVNGIDEQPGPGEPDYFPFGKVVEVAATTGQSPLVEAANAPVAAWAKAFGDSQPKRSIAQLLTEINDPAAPPSGMASYYNILRVGDHDRQPGADLNAMWYLRNAKIFGKLMQVAQPGDRVLVVYGSGHGYWLRHFARETPGFRSVDPRPFLKRAG